MQRTFYYYSSCHLIFLSEKELPNILKVKQRLSLLVQKTCISHGTPTHTSLYLCQPLMGSHNMSLHIAEIWEAAGEFISPTSLVTKALCLRFHYYPSRCCRPSLPSKLETSRSSQRFCESSRGKIKRWRGRG